ncbi:MAG: hypothetical protein EXS36_08500 [Pedosphaera sp.]|nr:hypothetical protein [Pedosphaera sp.]
MSQPLERCNRFLNARAVETSILGKPVLDRRREAAGPPLDPQGLALGIDHEIDSRPTLSGRLLEPLLRSGFEMQQDGFGVFASANPFFRKS